MSLRHKNTKSRVFAPSANTLYFYLGVFKTKDLFECAQFYNTLLHKKYTITLEGGFQFSFFFSPDNFYHLIGLEKLNNLSAFKGQSKTVIFKKFLKRQMPLKHIEGHRDYPKIANRIRLFDRIDKLLDKQHSKLIIEFDSDLVENTKLLKTVFIFFAHERSGYTHLTIGHDEGVYYPETFIYEDSKRYINEQDLLDIVDIKVENIGKKKK